MTNDTPIDLLRQIREALRVMIAHLFTFEAVHKLVDAKGIKCDVAHVTELPKQTVPLGESAAAAVSRLIEALEDHDDVKEVYANAEFPD